MHRAVLFIIFAVLATLSLAAPLPASKALTKLQFRVPVKGHPKLSGKDELAKVYRKYGVESVEFSPSSTTDDTAEAQPAAPVSSSSAPKTGPSPGSKSVAHPNGTGSGSGQGEVHATPETDDQEYISPVSIGGQTLNLDLDTGSSDLWVFSTNLPSNERSGHTAFDSSKSQTWSNYQGGSWQTSYGDSSAASGTVGFDTVNIGGAIVNKQCVELADAVSPQFVQDTQSDGIVGLGFSSINQVSPQPQKTFFENVLDDLDQPVFTADLSGSSGTYEFGNIDSSSYTGEIHYTPVDNSRGYWQFQVPSYSVGSKQQECGSQACAATIADTGTSLMLMDSSVVSAYYSHVQGAVKNGNAGWWFPCSASLPDFGITIGDTGYTAVIPGQDMTYERTGEQCMGSLQYNGGINLSILGDAFLKQQFAVFDAGNLRFGVAAKA